MMGDINRWFAKDDDLGVVESFVLQPGDDNVIKTKATSGPAKDVRSWVYVEMKVTGSC